MEAIEQLGLPHIRFFICGREEKKVICRIRLKENASSNVQSYLYAADMFAFPAKREGLELAAIRAVVTGLPF